MAKKRSVPNKDAERWQNATELDSMLDCLRGNAGDRKLRLFACACCRRIWRVLTDERSRRAVEVAEKYADRKASDDECLVCREEAYDANCDIDAPSEIASTAAAYNCVCPAQGFFLYASDAAGNVQAVIGGRESRIQAAFLRDIFGNPFQPLKINKTWLSWRDATIPKLAQAAYDERDLPSGHLDAKRLAILADALEEAGCTNEDVLAHLRGPGLHVRGCWVVDLLLGKE